MCRLVAFLAGLVAVAVLVGCARGDEDVTTTAQARWVITDLGTLGRSFISSEAVDINESGQIVGGSGTGSLGRAFIWQNGTMTSLHTLGGLESSAVAVNNRGQVIGGSLTRKPARGHAFLWQDGTMTDLGTLGGAYAAGSGAADINERGQVVGSSYSATISYGRLGGGVHAFLWQNGKMRDLGTLGRNPPTSIAVAINDRGEIIGNSPATGDWRAFLWRDGKMINLGSLGGGHSEAVAINERGQVIGGSIPAPVPVARDYRIGGSGRTHAVLWQDRKIIDLGTLDGPDIAAVDRFIDRTESDATAINEHGQAVGSSTTANGRGHAVLWTLKRG